MSEISSKRNNYVNCGGLKSIRGGTLMRNNKQKEPEHGWLLISGPNGSRETQDVIPVRGPEHFAGPECWCSPREDHRAKGLWIHNEIN